MNDPEELGFVPSTEQVRSHYVFNQSDVWSRERGVAFDDWLARVKAEAAATALEEAATYLRDYASEYEVAEKLITHANVYRSGVK